MTRFARMFGRAWVALVVALILLGYAATWYARGWAGLLEVLSPSNPWNYLVGAVSLVPGIAAIVWADRRDKDR